MHPNNTEDIVARLLAAEQQLEVARREITTLQNTVNRGKRAQRILPAVFLVSIALVLAWNHVSTLSAQGSGQTVTAPFKVVDRAGKIIAQVTDANGDISSRGLWVFNPSGVAVAQLQATPNGAGAMLVRNGQASKGGKSPGAGITYPDGQNPSLAMKGDDDKYFMSIAREGAVIRGPLSVTDNAEKTIVEIRDSTTTEEKDAKGQSKTVNLPRGLDVLSSQGKWVTRVGSTTNEGGFVLMRSPSNSSVAGLMITKKGSELALGRTDGSVAASLNTDVGLTLFDGATKKPAAALTWGLVGGLLEIQDGKGNAVVQAGATSDGRGLVKAGPTFVGTAGIQGVPTAIMGIKK